MRSGATGALVAAAVVATLAAAGCGGPSPAERAAAMRHWSMRADAACRKAQTAIVMRGEPRLLRDVGRVVRAGAADMRQAGAEIRALDVPPGAEARVRVLERDLDRSADAADALAATPPRLHALTRAVRRWRRAALPLQFSAAHLHLRACGTEAQVEAAVDAVLNPVFRWQLARFIFDFDRRMVALRRAYPPDRDYAYVHRLKDVLDTFSDRADAMDAPLRVRHERELLTRALEDMRNVAWDASDDLELGKTPRDMASRMERASRRARRCLRALMRAARPQPPSNATGQAS